MPYYLVSGKFEAYNSFGYLMNINVYINKIFEIEKNPDKTTGDIAADKAIKSIRIRMYLKYGTGIKVGRTFDLRIKKHSGIRKSKRKKERKIPQLYLPF